jgi:hypothetical protein
VTEERPSPDLPEDTDKKAARARIRHQETWVDLQIRRAIEKGEFEDLPGYGRPIEGLSEDHDPDWWVKKLIEREKITGVLPPSLQIRKEDAELDDRLDKMANEAEVRREVTEFNDRVRWTLYRPPEGPPMITRPRDPDTEVERWRARREERRTRRAREAAAERRRTRELQAEQRRRQRLRWFPWSGRSGHRGQPG